MKIEDEVKARLYRIFQMKVTFDAPGESREQQGLFVDVKTSGVTFLDKREIYKLEGTVRIFANQDKMPIGFISKMIRDAATIDVNPFHFGVEESAGTYRNITERSFDFVFLFDSQYDPSVGTLNAVNIEITET